MSIQQHSSPEIVIIIKYTTAFPCKASQPLQVKNTKQDNSWLDLHSNVLCAQLCLHKKHIERKKITAAVLQKESHSFYTYNATWLESTIEPFAAASPVSSQGKNKHHKINSPCTLSDPLCFSQVFKHCEVNKALLSQLCGKIQRAECPPTLVQNN